MRTFLRPFACFGAFAALAAAAACSSSSDQATPPDAGADGALSDASLAGDDGGRVPVFPQDGYSPPPFDGSPCGAALLTAVPRPSYVELVVDGSKQMNDSIAAVHQGIQKALAGSLDSVGLTVFADPADPTGGQGPYPSSADVALGPLDQAKRDAIDQRLKGLAALTGSRPTLLALRGAYAALDAFAASAPVAGGAKRVVLLTAGDPAAIGDAGASDGGADQSALDAAAAVFGRSDPTARIRTYVIGMRQLGGTPVFDPDFFAALAFAGGTGDANCVFASLSPGLDAGSACYADVVPGAPAGADLVARALELVHDVGACSFSIDMKGLAPYRINIALEGDAGPVVVNEDPANGWTFDDHVAPTGVELHGASCKAMIATSAKVVPVVGCTTKL